MSDGVFWSPDGNNYLVKNNSNIDIYDVATASIKQSTDFKEQINSLLFLNVSFYIKFWIFVTVKFDKIINHLIHYIW